MTKRISNYADLLREEEELKLQLQLQRDQIRMDIDEIKEELMPAKHALTFVGKFFKKDRSNPLMTGGAGMVIDLIVKKLILSRAGWITRLMVPFFLKNYSSHLLSEKKIGLWKKIKSWIWPGGKNGSPHYDQAHIDVTGDAKAN
jgi:hypothetical protein